MSEILRENNLPRSAEMFWCCQYMHLLPKKRDHILLRKEVIQPHLPVRLPCYDLALLTDLTLGDFPPCGLDHRLRVLSTQVA